MSMVRRLKPIIKKEFRQIFRDLRTLTLLVFMPVFLLILFGYALSFDVKHIRMAVYDQDRTRVSREFIQEFFNSEYFDQKYYFSDASLITEYLDEGKVAVVLVVPYDFSKNLLSGRSAPVQFLVDGSNANSASTVVGYTTAITQSYSLQVISDTILRKSHMNLVMPLDFRPRVWYNPELKSAKFLIPGLMAFILMVTSVIATSMSVVKEKERNTMEQIIVSPS